MMETLRFAGEDDDDLYSGFDKVHPALDTRHLETDQGFQEAVRTSYGRRPPVGTRMLYRIYLVDKDFRNAKCS